MQNIIYRQQHLTLAAERVISRRELLRTVPAAALAAGALNWTDVLTASAGDLRRRNKACILLWMAGGPSQFETFDPKPGHANGGETKGIATAMPGVQFAENLPQLAKIAHRLAVVRSMTTREGEHQRASYLMHTSYLPMASLQHPTLGSVAAHEIANAACELPAFVRIGPQPGGDAGYLGTRYNPLSVGLAGRVPDNSQITVDVERFQSRLGLSERMQAARDDAAFHSGEHQKLYREAAKMILSSQMQAFDLSKEPESVRDSYGIGAAAQPGNRAPEGMRDVFRGQFASACLLARRLIETGVTFVEATVPQWDTHADNFARSRSLCEQLDRPFAALIQDLAERGLLDSTLIVWMGEFGRSPRINPQAGRDHFPRAFSAVLAGGGVAGGRVVGATDAGGETITDHPVTEKDLFQTIYKLLGIDTQKKLMTPVGRPIRFVEDGAPVNELIA